MSLDSRFQQHITTYSLTLVLHIYSTYGEKNNENVCTKNHNQFRLHLDLLEQTGLLIIFLFYIKSKMVHTKWDIHIKQFRVYTS